MEVDITQAIKDVENSLRDFISEVLQIEFEDKWIENCGVTEERIIKWKENKEVEKKKQRVGAVEERLLYFAEIYDLSKIISKNWTTIFKNVFEEKKQFDVFFKIIEDLRNPDAHHRELLSYQKHLAMGISEYFRICIVRYRSNGENEDAYFPKFESVRDNYGNIYTPDKARNYSKSADGGTEIFRPGDNIEIIVTASDPNGEELLYVISPRTGLPRKWNENNVLNYKISNNDIGKSFILTVLVKSKRKFHAHDYYDDSVSFYYQVLPKVSQ